MMTCARPRRGPTERRYARAPGWAPLFYTVLVASVSLSACQRSDGDIVARLDARIVIGVADDAADTLAEGPQRELHVAGLKLYLPHLWQEVEAELPGELRFRRPAIQSERFGAELLVRGSSVSRPGDVEATMRHWNSRVQAANGEDAERTSVRSQLIMENGITIHFLEINGTYLRSMGGGPMTGGRSKALHGYRLVGSIVATQHGTALFEIVGPEATAREMERELRKMLGGLARGSGESESASESLPAQDESARPR